MCLWCGVGARRSVWSFDTCNECPMSPPLAALTRCDSWMEPPASHAACPSMKSLAAPRWRGRGWPLSTPPAALPAPPLGPDPSPRSMRGFIRSAAHTVCNSIGRSLILYMLLSSLFRLCTHATFISVSHVGGTGCVDLSAYMWEVHGRTPAPTLFTSVSRIGGIGHYTVQQMCVVLSG